MALVVRLHRRAGAQAALLHRLEHVSVPENIQFAFSPFRQYNTIDDTLTYTRVSRLESGGVYAGGNIADFCKRTNIAGRGVIYFGDHISADLAVCCRVISKCLPGANVTRRLAHGGGRARTGTRDPHDGSGISASKATFRTRSITRRPS